MKHDYRCSDKKYLIYSVNNCYKYIINAKGVRSKLINIIENQLFK